MNTETGIVRIHDKDYKTVALRVKQFRADHPDWSIVTDVVDLNAEGAVIKATVMDERKQVMATGLAEEKRGSSGINKTSALENCETSAVGRALAFLGYCTTDIASQEEIEAANTPISDERLAELRANVEKYGVDLPKFCRYLGVESLPEIPVYKWPMVEKAIELKKKRAAA